MATVNCNQCQKLLGGLLDATLDAATQAEVRAHVEGCPLCSSCWRDLQQVWEQLNQTQEIKPSTGFVERTVRAALAPEEKTKISLPPWIFWPVPKRSWMMASVGATLLAFALGCWLIHWTTQPPSEFAVGEQREFLSQFPLLANFDLLQDFDVIEHLDTLADSDADSTDAL